MRLTKTLIPVGLVLMIGVSACVNTPTPQTTIIAETNPETQTESTPTHKPGCTVQSKQPTPGATQQSILPPPGEDDWSKGPEDAYVTIIEYGDFQ